jgi:transglutaminase superfamily protein
MIIKRKEVFSTMKLLISVCFLVFLYWILGGVLVSAAGEETYLVAYTYGFVEVKKHGQQNWERVRKNEELSDFDLVRIPPGGVFRIQEPGGEFANIPAGQEKRMQELARLRKRKMANVMKYTAGLPTDNERSSPASRDRKANRVKPPPGISNELLSQKIIIDDVVNSLATEVQNAITEEVIIDYPSREIAFANRMFSVLQTKNIRPLEDISSSVKLPSETLSQRKGTDYDYAVLYCALLRAGEVPARIQLIGNSVYVILNSNIPSKDPLRITSNTGIYIENATVWLPLRLAISEVKFLNAWYNGRKVVQQRRLMELKRKK